MDKPNFTPLTFTSLRKKTVEVGGETFYEVFFGVATFSLWTACFVLTYTFPLLNKG